MLPFERPAFGHAPLRRFLNLLSMRPTLILVLTASFAAFSSSVAYYLIEKERHTAHQKRDIEQVGRQAMLEAEDTRDQLTLDIVQVQQYLTDFSATRGEDNLGDGLALAEKYAQKFQTDIERAKVLAKDSGSDRLYDQLEHLKSAFPDFYRKGDEMARAYADQGTKAGNQLMPDFDAASDKLQELLDETQSEVSIPRQSRGL